MQVTHSKILHYNYGSVARIIKEKRPMMIFPFLSNDFSYKLFDTYEKLGLHKNAVYDRSGAIPHYLRMSPIHPMPKYDPNYNRNFYDIVEERAKELLALGKPIKVCWSGGLDSTFVLFTLLRYANDKSQITVYGTYASIIESGDVFDKFIKNNIQFEINVYPTEKTKKIEENCILVSGFQGNQLFGPTDNFFADGSRPVTFFHHTMGTPTTIYEDYKKYIAPELLEFLQPAIDRSPRKIETVADVRWYCIFNMDWYNGLYTMKAEMPFDKMKTVHHFFETEEFEKWAIHTKEPWTKIKGDPNTHRWQMREALAEYGLKDYAKYKAKAISNFALIRNDWFFLLEDYKNVYF